MAADRKRLGFLSSLAASRGVILLCLALSLLANWAGLGSLGAFLFFLFLLGLAARVWGLAALRGVSAGVAAERALLSVGEEIALHYTVKNEKLLPLIWLELWQSIPPNGCLTPASGFSLRPFEGAEAEAEGVPAVYRRRLLFLMGYQSLTWETVWRAERRGVYRLKALGLRSGDGFGLTQGAGTSLLHRPLTLAVWPRLIPVHTAPFFRTAWQGETGRQGWIEDPTVLRGLRPYLAGDSWKKIDWRTAARQDALYTRQFEMVQPASIHFILDAASFWGLSENQDELEDMISVLASLILELDRLGVRCGLSLPGIARQITLSPDDPGITAADLLLALSEFQADPAGSFDEEALSSLTLTAGQLWLATYSGERLGCSDLFWRLEGAGLSVLCADPLSPGPLAGRYLLPLAAVKKGGIQ